MALMTHSTSSVRACCRASRFDDVDGSIVGKFDAAAADAGFSQVEVEIVDGIEAENWAFSTVMGAVGEEVVEDAVVGPMEDVAQKGIFDTPDVAGDVVPFWH